MTFPAEATAGATAGATAEATAGAAGAKRRRRRLVVIIPVVFAVAITGGLVAFTRLISPKKASDTGNRVELTTTAVRKGDLVQQVTADATVGYGASSVIAGRRAGTLTWLPPAGTVIDRGEPLYAVDAVGVPLFFGDIPTYRAIATGVPDGADVAMVQQNLAAMGYKEVGKATGHFGPGTERALKRWQKKLKQPETGALQPQDVLVLPGPVRVESTTAQLGAQAGAEVMRVTGTERLVTATLDPAQRALAGTGVKVTIVLPDGRTVAGTVRGVTTAAPGQAGQARSSPWRSASTMRRSPAPSRPAVRASSSRASGAPVC
jgi:hypothetical protein